MSTIAMQPMRVSAPARGPARLGARVPALRPAAPLRRMQPTSALDWSDPDTQIGALGAVFGVLVGIGTPLFYIIRTERDEDRLEELRALNRATKEETGEYLTDEEIADIRPPRWTDRREYQDSD